MVFLHQAMHCFSALVSFEYHREALLKGVLHPAHDNKNDDSTAFSRCPEEQDGNQLVEKMVQMWLVSSDCDDVESRMTAMGCAFAVALLPMGAGSGCDFWDHLLGRLDDSSDAIRLGAAQAMKEVLFSTNSCPSVAFAVKQKIALTAKKLLIHLDDHDEKVGLKDVIVTILKRLIGIDAETVKALVQQARPKHFTQKYCDEVLDFVPNK